MRFDFTDLRLFLHVQQAGSITAGAARSHLTLQAPSERIRGMEEALGVALLPRVSNGVTLTAAGFALARHANTLLQQRDHMQSELQQFGNGLRGHIALLCNASALSLHLPSRLSDYLITHPRISLNVSEKPSHEIVDAINNQRAEVGIVADSVPLQGLETREFCLDPLVVVMAVTSPWATSTVLAFEALLDAEFVGLNQGSALQEHIDHHARQRGKRLNYRVRLNDFPALIGLIQHGIGIGIVPEKALAHADTQQIRAIALSDAWAQRRLLLCARQFSALPGYLQEFVEHISDSQASAPDAEHHGAPQRDQSKKETATK